MKTNKSPYSASMTGCGLVFNEFNAVLPLLMEPNGKDLLKNEVRENRYLMMNSENIVPLNCRSVMMLCLYHSGSIIRTSQKKTNA